MGPSVLVRVETGAYIWFHRQVTIQSLAEFGLSDRKIEPYDQGLQDTRLLFWLRIWYGVFLQLRVCVNVWRGVGGGGVQRCVPLSTAIILPPQTPERHQQSNRPECVYTRFWHSEFGKVLRFFGAWPDAYEGQSR